MNRKPRRRPSKLEEDPVVADVRRWRAELMDEAGGTLKGLLDLVYGKDRNTSRVRAAPTRSRKRRSRGRAV